MAKKLLGDPIPRDEPYIVPAKPEEEYDNICEFSIKRRPGRRRL